MPVGADLAQPLQSPLVQWPMTTIMRSDDLTLLLLWAGGGAAAACLLLRAVGTWSHGLARELVNDRRASEERRCLANAQAEADGEAAALEPLAINSDGSVQEPILGLVEGS